MTTPADGANQPQIKEQLQKHLEEIHHEVADLNRDPKNTQAFKERLQESDLKIQDDLKNVKDPKIREQLQDLHQKMEEACKNPSLESAGPVAKDVFQLERELKKTS